MLFCKNARVVLMVLLMLSLTACKLTQSEEPHPFAVALAEFYETIPGDDILVAVPDDITISHTSAYLIDLDGNGTQGVIAYKAFGEYDNFCVFYLHNGELKTSEYATQYFYLHEIGEAPLVNLAGGEGAGRYYSVMSLTSEGLAAAATLWATVHGEFYYNDEPISEEKFSDLLEQYDLNDDRWLSFSLKPQTNSDGYVIRSESVAGRPDDTERILKMTAGN